ncbi:IPT/TIG domain-containing protein, partial [Candidatus Uhrbacteria bacterium]|nr:IPT/TIG domain-containing protein [Candidatus Uhrbacteria bacterium]
MKRIKNQELRIKNVRRYIVPFFLFSLFVILYSLFATPAFAQVNTGLDQLTATGLGTTNIRVTVGNIIRIFLGLLGVVAITLILVGGFLWMTAAGNEEKIAKAKQLLLNAVIGLAIVLGAFAITSFVLSRLISATEGGAGDVSGVGGGETSGGRLPADAFTVRAIQPSGDVTIRNITVRLFFTKSVDPKTVDGNITVVKIADSVGVAGKLAVDGAVVTFTPDVACPEPNADRKCFDASTGYRVEAVARAVQSADGKELLCGIGGVCKSAFKSGTRVDTAPPKIEITSPSDGEFVPDNTGIPIDFTATDDSGVAYAEVTAGGQKITVTPPGATPLRWNGGTVWDTTGKASGSSHTITAKAFDIDTNTPGDSNVVTVKLRAAHCFNGAQDGSLTPAVASETGIDCGGSDCGACNGASCTVSDQCASGACSAGKCVDYPTITRVVPLDGALGNFITIFGHGFGAMQGSGSVVFLGNDGVGDDKLGATPQACGTGDLWRDDRIIIAVPVGAVAGPLKITNNAGLWDDTANARGGQYFFTPSLTVRPGLCSVVPVEGTLGTAVAVSGVNFGTTKGKLLIGNTDAGSDTVEWANTSIRGGAVPNLVPGSADVMVVQGNEQSNPIAFRMKESVGAPRIDTMTPVTGPQGTYVTLQGSNFGTAGTAYFVSAAGTEKIADVTFPAACSADYWAPTAVTVKVPSDLGPGAYTVFIKRDNAMQSNSKDFSVTSGTALPGLCRLNPDNGPAGLSVAIVGDRFGDAQGKNGKVKFNAEKGQEAERRSAPIKSWSDQTVSVNVPLLATLGQVQLVDSAGTLSSNTLPFDVKDCRAIGGCGKGEQCCGDGACREAGTCAESAPQCTFAWKFTTGVGTGPTGTGNACPDPKAVNGGCGAGTSCVNGACLDAIPHVVEEESCTTNTQSPSPYRETKNACMNAEIAVRFTRNMQDAGLAKTDNITLVECNTGDAFKPANCGTTNLGVVFDADTGWIAHNTEGEGAAYTPVQTLAANTWYRVTIKSGTGGMQSQEGKFLDGDNDGKEGGDYTWTFHTASVPCAVDSVRVTPVQATIDSPTKTQDFTSVATAANCNILNDDTYAWSWLSDKDPGNVTLAPKTPSAKTITTPKNETPANDPALITADIPALSPRLVYDAHPLKNKLFNSELTIAYPAPSVIERWPSCTAA